MKKMTSNGYEIYYDEASGEAVGIVYNNLVFLKTVSERRMDWDDAAAYCKTIVINGITAELCPVTKNWRSEISAVYSGLQRALKEIGAEKSDCCTWCCDCDSSKLHSCIETFYPWSKMYYAWVQSFENGNVIDTRKHDSFYVRPVLVLKR